MRLMLCMVILLLAGCLAPATEPNEPSTPESNSGSGAPEQPGTTPTPPDNAPEVLPPVTGGNETTNETTPEAPLPWKPQVVVGTYDNGVNPYHQAFYRPNRTEPPCTYMEGMPCHIIALNLSVGGDDLDAMMAADEEILASVKANTWYWIPKTSIVAFQCNNNIQGGQCFLPGDPSISSDHGTKTLSSIGSEAPDASLVFATSSAYPDYFRDSGILIDILSKSSGPAVPLPVPNTGLATGPIRDFLMVDSAGNTPKPTLIEGQTVHPEIIVVGGAYDTPAEEAEASKIVDVVSYYCRPLASGWSATELVNDCGTSFAGPTVAGALAQTLLDIRQTTGYTGTTQDGIMDPNIGLTIQGLREAMNHTATYEPTHRFDESSRAQPVPLNPEMPWVQFGWGFVDGQLSDTMTQSILANEYTARPEGAVTYMELIQSFREAYYGDK